MLGGALDWPFDELFVSLRGELPIGEAERLGGALGRVGAELDGLDTELTAGKLAAGELVVAELIDGELDGELGGDWTGRGCAPKPAGSDGSAGRPEGKLVASPSPEARATAESSSTAPSGSTGSSSVGSSRSRSLLTGVGAAERSGL